MTGTLSNRFFWLWSVGALIVYVGAILLVAIACVIYAGVGNITAAILSEELRFSTKLSVLTATVSTILSLIVGIPAAYALARYRGRFKALVDTLLDLPIVMPPVALGVALLVFFTQFPSQEGSVERWLEALGRPIVYEVPAIVVAQFAVVSGYALRILKAAFESQDPRLRDVARTLGLSQWKIFFWIELPQSTTSLLAATVLLWARAMGEFGATVVLAGATPGKTDVLPISIYLALNRGEIDKALAASVVLILVAVMALFLFRKLVQRAV